MDMKTVRAKVVEKLDQERPRYSRPALEEGMKILENGLPENVLLQMNATQCIFAYREGNDIVLYDGRSGERETRKEIKRQVMTPELETAAAIQFILNGMMQAQAVRFVVER